ncbi:hypothetical protein F441_10406 [Phytophthora nicotianae CJ01A1]|uniref:Uncharacterized protein n=6 Tax=Phytophthora nicotianae TaxID=4792 RepID=W2R8S0_PHYN3|nr:hypothetical protein PPTG_21143 [Phytophthora nicotianae INRA-310]ETI44862.1 hypothetical protein F443_10464 [Phytophthora nicotianae P1569]ETK84847.1 hypothetical protein L915_10226 [Phytophthora nicotianae]ETO73495.1 hypothetical protein F444_10558 [Phytophthora nicotianae P1976]ETP14669.1 hypothetical protein F441_10406 [Phytophthora nicotianae CJ01A1]ETP42740.1 hypothetical protein F442_10367 [Phytophthora nicotianae P10297]
MQQHEKRICSTTPTGVVNAFVSSLKDSVKARKDSEQYYVP